MTVLPFRRPMGLPEVVQALADIGAEPAMRHDREGREYWLHRCAHPDHHDSWPSATTTEQGGTLLLNCFSCAPSGPSRARWVAQVLARLQAGTPKDPPTGGRPRSSGGHGGATGEKVAHYDYLAPDGRIVARKVRFQHGARKSFLWQRPHGEHWADGLRGTPLRELPLYGWQTITHGKPVYVVEGEKDADRLHSMGEAAVTAAGSQPGDIPADLSQLAGLACFVVADRDEVGIRLALAWRDRLAEQPGAVVILAQPRVDAPKADISDHLDAGHTLAELDFGTPQVEPPGMETGEIDAPTGALASRIDWVAAYAADTQRVDWLVDGLIERGRLVALYSAPKAGKSLVALDMAAALATGRPVLGQPATGEQIPILYADYENTPGDVVDRLRDLGYDDPLDLAELHYLSLPSIPPLDTIGGGEALLAAALEVGAQMVVVDTASRTISGEENTADTWNEWYRCTGIALKRAGIALLRLDHSGKDAKKGQRGSSAKSGDVDLVLHLVADGDLLTLIAEQRRQGYYLERLMLRRCEVDGVLTHVTTNPVDAVDEQVAALLAWLETEGVPGHYGRPAVAEHMEARGYRASKRVLEAALRHRRAGMPRTAGRERGKGGKLGGKPPISGINQGTGQPRAVERAAGRETSPQTSFEQVTGGQSDLLPTICPPSAHQLPGDNPGSGTNCPPAPPFYRKGQGAVPGHGDHVEGPLCTGCGSVNPSRYGVDGNPICPDCRASR